MLNNHKRYIVSFFPTLNAKYLTSFHLALAFSFSNLLYSLRSISSVTNRQIRSRSSPMRATPAMVPPTMAAIFGGCGHSKRRKKDWAVITYPENFHLVMVVGSFAFLKPKPSLEPELSRAEMLQICDLTSKFSTSWEGWAGSSCYPHSFSFKGLTGASKREGTRVAAKT